MERGVDGARDRGVGGDVGRDHGRGARGLPGRGAGGHSARHARGRLAGARAAHLSTHGGHAVDSQDRPRPALHRVVRLRHNAQGRSGVPDLVLSDRRRHHRGSTVDRSRHGAARPLHGRAPVPDLPAPQTAERAPERLRGSQGGIHARRGVLLQSSAQLNTPLLFATLVTLSLLAMAFFFVVESVERLLIPWHVSQRARPS